MNWFGCSAVVLALAPLLLASDLIYANSSLDELPDQIVFDCGLSSEGPRDYFEPLNRRMRVPKNFMQSSDDPSWYNWDVRLVSEDGSRVVRFAAIQFGEFDTGMDWIEREFTLVSRALDNGYGVDIYLNAPQPDAHARDNWLFLLSEDDFLKVVSPAQIDWNSLLACFE